jgi:ankyrin repeat protein
MTLRRAVFLGDVAVVGRLLDEGVGPDDGRAKQLSVLAAAAQRGSTDIVGLLLDHGADPAWSSPRGWTAATFADAEGFGDIADRIIAAGAPAASRSAHGYGQLHRAARRGDADTLRLLTRAGPVDSLDAQGDTPLMLAVHHRNEDAADVLLTAGADPDHVTDGWSTLGEGAYQDSVLDQDTSFVDRLLRAGADANPAGYPPVLCAINQEGCSASVLRRLVAAGADITATGADGGTVLHRVAGIAEEAALVDASLDLGAALEARDDRGRTPLLAAADATNDTTFIRLAERGADIDARDHDGRSVIDLVDPWPEADTIRAFIHGAAPAGPSQGCTDSPSQ